MQYTELTRRELIDDPAGALLYVAADGEVQVRPDLVAFDGAAVRVAGTPLVAVGVSLTIADVIAAAAGSRLLYTDADGKIQELPALTPGQILVADASGLPVGDAGMTFDGPNATLSVPIIQSPDPGTLLLRSESTAASSVSLRALGAAYLHGGVNGSDGFDVLDTLTGGLVQMAASPAGIVLTPTTGLIQFLNNAGEWDIDAVTAALYPPFAAHLNVGTSDNPIGSLYAATSVVTPLIVLDGDTVTLGDADSGGTGYRLLRVPNAA